MREDLFEHDMFSNNASGASCQGFACTQCGAMNLLNQTSNAPVKHRRLRRGNYFSQFTKNFSLGNGPADWVAEYLVTKESGKMLGTLVALSVARMPNLVGRSILLLSAVIDLVISGDANSFNLYSLSTDYLHSTKGSYPFHSLYPPTFRPLTPDTLR